MSGSSNFTVDLWIWRCLGFALDWPALSSSSALPLLWICSWSLASLRYNQATPPCWGSSKLSRSPFLFQVLNWKPIDTPPDEDIVVPGNWRKLSGPVNVTATETGSAHEKVTLPWEGNTQSGEKEEVWQKKKDTIEIKQHKTWILISYRGRADLTSCLRDLISKSP